MDCNNQAPSSAVIAGLDWLAQNVQLPAVASMSIATSSPSDVICTAVAAVIALGVTAVAAAGNSGLGKELECSPTGLV